MSKQSQQSKVPVLGAENSEKNKSLEEQLSEKRQQEFHDFQSGYKALCEKFGYQLVPEFRLTVSGLIPDLKTEPTRNF